MCYEWHCTLDVVASPLQCGGPGSITVKVLSSCTPAAVLPSLSSHMAVSPQIPSGLEGWVFIHQPPADLTALLPCRAVVYGSAR